MAKSPVMRLKSELQTLSRKDLEKHRAHVEQAIEKLDARNLDDARAKLEKHARELGVSLSDILESTVTKAPRQKSKAAAKAKYRNPDNSAETWTGRGRPPAWYKTRVEAGTDPASMAI